MKFIYLTITYMLLLAASCRKEVPVTEEPPTPVDKSKPTLLWKTPFTNGTISYEPGFWVVL